MEPIEQLRQAIENEGPKPRYHREIMERHREEWPTLWAAIDRLLESEDRVWVEFGATRPDGVTVNRVPGEWAKQVNEDRMKLGTVAAIAVIVLFVYAFVKVLGFG